MIRSFAEMQNSKTREISKAEAHIQKKYAEKFLLSLNWLRAWDLICDLTLNVGNESFPVHSPVLAAASKYFFELIKAKDSGVKNNVIELKDMLPHVVLECIEFMYTGGADVTLENVYGILSASEVFKLEDLTELCLEFLSNNVTVDNCFAVKSLFEKYGHDKKSDKLGTFLSGKSKHVIGTSGFLNLDKKNFELYLKSIQLDFELVWHAIRKWVFFDVADRKQHYFELISLHSGCFPAAFMLGTIWEDHLTKQSQRTKDLIGNILLNDIGSFKDVLTSTNCFLAKRLCEVTKHPNSNEAHGEVRLFMIKHFEDICDNDAILTISKDEIFQIFRSPKTKYPSETVKWKVALEWVKYDLPSRKEHFPTLLASIKLENMPLNFLQEEVRAEELVQQFDECKEILMDAFFAIANPSEPTSQPASATPQSPKSSPGKRRRKKKSDAVASPDVLTSQESVTQQIEWNTPTKSKSLAPKSSSGIVTESPKSSPIKRGRKKTTDVTDIPINPSSKSMSETPPTASTTPRKLKPLDQKSSSRITTDSPKASPATRGRKKRTDTENISSPAAKRPKQDSDVGDITFHESVVSSSTDKPYLAVFDTASGRVKGLDILQVQWNILAITKVAKDAYQGIVSSQKKMFLLKGTDFFAFDAVKKSWDRRPSKQKKPAKCSQMVVWEGNIYVLQDGHYDIFNIAEEKWIEQKPFISPGVGFCACVLMNDIYAFGGKSQPKRGIKYNVLTESISNIEPLVIGRMHAAAVSLKNKVYVLGGTVDPELGASTESYDFVTDTWTTMMNMQVKRSHFSACTYNGNIYAIGGGLPHTGTMDTVELYGTSFKDKFKWRIFHRMLRMSDSASTCIVDIPHDS